MSLSQYLHVLTDINRESTKTLSDGLYPFRSSALWVKSIKQTENWHRNTPPTHFPNPVPLLLSLRGSLLYLQLNQSVSQRWAVCLQKHRLLTSQRKNKETNKRQNKTKQKTKKQKQNRKQVKPGKKLIYNKNQKSIVKHTEINQQKTNVMKVWKLNLNWNGATFYVIFILLSSLSAEAQWINNAYS